MEDYRCPTCGGLDIGRMIETLHAGPTVQAEAIAVPISEAARLVGVSQTTIQQAIPEAANPEYHYIGFRLTSSQWDSLQEDYANDRDFILLGGGNPEEWPEGPLDDLALTDWFLRQVDDHLEMNLGEPCLVQPVAEPTP